MFYFFIIFYNLNFKNFINFKIIEFYNVSLIYNLYIIINLKIYRPYFTNIKQIFKILIKFIKNLLIFNEIK